METPIYLDNHATTPVDPRVLEAMLPYFTRYFGNAASRNHPFGWQAERGIERARDQIAALIGATAKEIVFTSGSTESNNLAIKGVAEMHRERGNHIITAPTEHKAVIDTCKHLEQTGFEITFLKVDKHGRVSPDDVRAAITDKTILITLMAANNEVGTLHPIGEIGKIAKQKGVLFHTDATQAVGKVPFHVDELGVDLVSLTAHKMYGPKGCGALYVRRKNPRVRIAAQMHGGGHERGMRSGTLNVPGIVGFGKACELCQHEMAEESVRIAALRDELKNLIMTQLDHVYLNGHPVERLPGNLNISFAYVEGEALMMGIKDVAVSSGSACTSASLEPSHVLKAMGVGEDLAHTSIRFGLGRFNTQEEVHFVGKRVVDEVRRLREMSPLYEMAREGIDLASVKWQPH